MAAPRACGSRGGKCQTKVARASGRITRAQRTPSPNEHAHARARTPHDCTQSRCISDVIVNNDGMLEAMRLIQKRVQRKTFTFRVISGIEPSSLYCRPGWPDLRHSAAKLFPKEIGFAGFFASAILSRQQPWSTDAQNFTGSGSGSGAIVVVQQDAEALAPVLPRLEWSRYTSHPFNMGKPRTGRARGPGVSI